METGHSRTETAPEEQQGAIPRDIDWEIKDLVQPIVLRRQTLWRSGIVAGFLVMAVAVAWFVFFPPPSGKALLNEAVEAAGGMAAWNAIETGAFTRVHTVYDEDEEPVRTVEETYFFRKGDQGERLTITTTGDAGHARIGRDDQGYWATLDGEPADPDALARSMNMMCESDECTPTCGMELAFYRFSMPFKLTDPGVIPTHGGETMLGGRTVALLHVSFEEGVGSDRWTLYVDEETKLIRKVEYYGNADAEVETPPQEIYWSDHRPGGDLTFSHRRTYYRSNGTRLEDYVITDMDFTSPLPDGILKRPEGFQPVAMQQ